MTGVGRCSDCRRRCLPQSGRQGIAPRVTETLVPEIHGGGDKAVVHGSCGDGVELAVVITSEDHLLCAPFLDRKTEVIKLNINGIIVSEGFNRDEIFDYIWADKNISEGEWRRCSGKDLVAGVCDRQGRSVAKNYVGESSGVRGCEHT